VRIASRIGLGVALGIGTLFATIPRALLALFGMEDPKVVELGTQLLRYLAVSGFFITVALAYTGALQGTGDTRSPLVISIVSQIIFPLGICAVLEATGTLEPAEIWTAIVIGHFMRCTLSVWRFKQERWRRIAVDLGPATV